jgi:hypothetical protein
MPEECADVVGETFPLSDYMLADVCLAREDKWG